MDSIAFTQERMKRQFDDLQDKTQVWFHAQSKHPVLHKETYDLKISFLAYFDLKKYSLTLSGMGSESKKNAHL